jgi:hypothetical protein
MSHGGFCMSLAARNRAEGWIMYGHVRLEKKIILCLFKIQVIDRDFEGHGLMWPVNSVDLAAMDP